MTGLQATLHSANMLHILYIQNMLGMRNNKCNAIWINKVWDHFELIESEYQTKLDGGG